MTALIRFELRMRHVKGPDFDWWTPGDQRVSPSKLEDALIQIRDSEVYRNVTVEDDPHDNHGPDCIDYGMTGMYVDCKVEGCTWSKDYD